MFTTGRKPFTSARSANCCPAVRTLRVIQFSTIFTYTGYKALHISVQACAPWAAGSRAYKVHPACGLLVAGTDRGCGSARRSSRRRSGTRTSPGRGRLRSGTSWSPSRDSALQETGEMREGRGSDWVQRSVQTETTKLMLSYCVLKDLSRQRNQWSKICVDRFHLETNVDDKKRKSAKVSLIKSPPRIRGAACSAQADAVRSKVGLKHTVRFAPIYLIFWLISFSCSCLYSPGHSPHMILQVPGTLLYLSQYSGNHWTPQGHGSTAGQSGTGSRFSWRTFSGVGMKLLSDLQAPCERVHVWFPVSFVHSPLWHITVICVRNCERNCANADAMWTKVSVHQASPAPAPAPPGSCPSYLREAVPALPSRCFRCCLRQSRPSLNSTHLSRTNPDVTEVIRTE